VKPALIIVLAALSGAVTAALVMSTLRPTSTPGPARTTANRTEVDLGESLTGVEREIRLLREELASVRHSIDRVSVGGPAVSSSGSMTDPGDTPTMRGPATMSRATTSSPTEGSRFRAGAPVLSRLMELSAWEEDAAYRRRWILRDERAVLEWFGMPDSIDADGDSEEWYYELPNGELDEDGDPILESFQIYLNRGRMVSGEYDD